VKFIMKKRNRRMWRRSRIGRRRRGSRRRRNGELRHGEFGGSTVLLERGKVTLKFFFPRYVNVERLEAVRGVQ
jgi:hypothetical protein